MEEEEEMESLLLQIDVQLCHGTLHQVRGKEYFVSRVDTCIILKSIN